MSELMNLQKLTVKSTDGVAPAAISWGSCDSGSCNQGPPTPVKK